MIEAISMPVSTPDASTASEWSISDLTAAVAAGDPDAFSCLYSRYFQVLCNEARRVSRRDEAFCLDVVHDTMLRVLKHLRPLETEDRLLGWLKTVVRRCAFDLLRAEQRRRRREALVAGQPLSPVDDAQTLLIRDEEIEWLRRQIAELAPRTARMLLLRQRLGWTLERIGATVGLSSGAVDGRIRRVRAALRRNGRRSGHV